MTVSQVVSRIRSWEKEGSAHSYTTAQIRAAYRHLKKMAGTDPFGFGEITASDVLAVLAKKRNPSRRLTKAQRRVNASKRSTKRRVAKALQKFLKAQNPAAKFAGAKIRRNKGSITIIPIKLRRASR